ncbi:MAG TPA: hypothetical protein VF082_12690 [Jiangellaceae bacterium]
MNLAEVMDAVAARLDTIDGLRVHANPGQAITPPGGVVLYPEDYTYDATYGRGMDRMTLPVLLVVGKASDRAARDALGAYCDGDGPKSVKRVLEAGGWCTEFDTLRVVDADFDVYTIAGTDYIGALFELDIAGPGSS